MFHTFDSFEIFLYIQKHRFHIGYVLKKDFSLSNHKMRILSTMKTIVWEFLSMNEKFRSKKGSQIVPKVYGPQSME